MNEHNDEWADIRSNADKDRKPDLLAGRAGRHLVSMRALVERIAQSFRDEYLDTPVLREADTPTKRLKLLLGTTDYILAIESLQLEPNAKANVIAQAYSDIFGYGPLDAYFVDERVTTIALDGPDKAAIRYGHGDLAPVGPLFDDDTHLRRIVRRLLLDAGTDFSDNQPFMEIGLRVGERAICVNLLLPPIAPQLTADIRVHPTERPALDTLAEQGFLSEQAKAILIALAQSGHGIVIVGDTESGKTTLLNALAQVLPEPEQTVAVERAGEIHLPVGMRRLVPQWPLGEQAGITYGEQIGQALGLKPSCLLLDEVRSDEPGSIAPLLREDDMPRQIWSFRGPFSDKRLRAALTMLARRADMVQGEVLVEALYRRLPFIVTVWRAHGQIRLYSIAEWQFTTDYPDYVMLLETRDGTTYLTGKRPQHTLDLPEDFWA